MLARPMQFLPAMTRALPLARSSSLPGAAALLLLGAHLSACGGGEAESATAAFTSSGCKSKPRMAALVAIGTDASVGGGDRVASGDQVTSGDRGDRVASGERVGDDDGDVAPQVEGLTCVRWARTASADTIFHLYNVAGGCGAEYDGKATLADDGRTVKLALTNPTGRVAACGSCLYDFTFAVRGVATTGTLDVEILRSNTATAATGDAQTFRLEASDRTRGIACTHASRWALQDHARKTGRLGTRNMPCGPVTGEEVACDPGLACTALPGDEAGQVCLAACEADADCPHPEAYACDARLCRPRPPAR